MLYINSLGLLVTQQKLSDLYHFCCGGILFDLPSSSNFINVLPKLMGGKRVQDQ